MTPIIYFVILAAIAIFIVLGFAVRNPAPTFVAFLVLGLMGISLLANGIDQPSEKTTESVVTGGITQEVETIIYAATKNSYTDMLGYSGLILGVFGAFLTPFALGGRPSAY